MIEEDKGMQPALCIFNISHLQDTANTSNQLKSLLLKKQLDHPSSVRTITPLLVLSTAS